MPIRLLSTHEDFTAYDAWVKTHPQGNLWQSLEWKKYQEAIGREIRIYAAFENDAIAASALVSIDRTTGGFSTWDIPRGPLGNFGMENMLKKIMEDAKKDKCLCLYLSPMQSFSILNSQFSIHFSSRHEQPEATRILDLTLSAEELLAQMHQKGRYNIKVAQKNDIVVEQAIDIRSFATLSEETSARDGFVAASGKQYETFLNQQAGSFLLLAYAPKNPKPIAGLLGVTWNGTGIYYYGASDYAHRALMAPYLLQWEAIKLCKNLGCAHYDLLGIAPMNAPGNHPWLGISDFKARFGGSVVTYPKEQEIVLKPVMKRMLKMKRKLIG